MDRNLLTAGVAAIAAIVSSIAAIYSCNAEGRSAASADRANGIAERARDDAEKARWRARAERLDDEFYRLNGFAASDCVIAEWTLRNENHEPICNGRSVSSHERMDWIVKALQWAEQVFIGKLEAHPSLQSHFQKRSQWALGLFQFELLCNAVRSAGYLDGRFLAALPEECRPHRPAGLPDRVDALDMSAEDVARTAAKQMALWLETRPEPSDDGTAPAPRDPHFRIPMPPVPRNQK